ncbi:MAG: sirohydrochlorin chelatase [Candidatus Thorarchaeota archaeon]|jgi:sirohydrochlorin cobaltochelatase
MITRIVLAMHGMPANDFPEDEVVELVKLHRMIEKAGDHPPAEMRVRYEQLDQKVRNWKRTTDNDPFWASSRVLADELETATGFEVFVGFNEFCGPSLEEAIDAAAGGDSERVIVVTPMMTPGGEHSEEDIPEAISSAKRRFKSVEFVYAWPFPTADVASFLARQIDKFQDAGS